MNISDTGKCVYYDAGQRFQLDLIFGTLFVPFIRIRSKGEGYVKRLTMLFSRCESRGHFNFLLCASLCFLSFLQ